MRYLFITAAAIVFVGCAAPNEPVAPVGVLMPLAVGNTWIGEWREYGSSGAVRRAYFDTAQVEKDTVIDGERRALFNWQNGYVNRADGLYGWGLGPGNEPQLMFKYPTVVGEYTLLSPYGPITVRVVSTSERVVVAAGTFTCYHYMTAPESPEVENHFYYAPNIGNVKNERIDRRNPAVRARAVFELSEYRLN